MTGLLTFEHEGLEQVVLFVTLEYLVLQKLLCVNFAKELLTLGWFSVAKVHLQGNERDLTALGNGVECCGR